MKALTRKPAIIVTVIVIAAAVIGIALLLPAASQLKRRYQFGYEAAAFDIEFTGKVVDQFGSPVVGATIRYFLGGQLLHPGSGQGRETTDANGLFTLAGEGANVVIQGIYGDDIQYLSGDAEELGRRQSLIMGSYTQVIIEDWQSYTADNPYVFEAWRITEPANINSGGTGGNLQLDGTWLSLDLTFQFPDPRSQRSEPRAGMLDIRCFRGPYGEGSEKKRSSWRVDIVPRDGGIQPVQGRYMNEAPLEGYQPELSAGFEAGDPDYQPMLLNQRYYFTADGGAVYGALFVRFSPFRAREDCTVYVSYKYNLDGGRALGRANKL